MFRIKFRFSNHVAASNWLGIRAANSFENICIQVDENNNRAGAEDYFATSYEMDPWSGFVWGCSNSCGAKYLLDKGIILVTMVYRFGIFEFFSTGDSVTPGNFRMKDQVLALKWVQKYIKYSEGDSSRVTLFQQSTEGASVAIHAISKASSGTSVVFLFIKYKINPLDTKP